jgi:hypothetical protein
MNSRIAKVLRLRAAELDAERRYGAAVQESDLSAVRNAAADWRKAAAALAQYVAKYPLPFRNSG